MKKVADAAALLSPEAVRDRCEMVLDLALAKQTAHFSVDLARLDDAAELVVSEIRLNYPGGKVPLHSRWRHFEFGGRDLWAELVASAAPMQTDVQARARMDLAVMSVLLDAGAGANWSYHDRSTGIAAGRSEGLALASLRMFASGLLSDQPSSNPLRVDQRALEALTPDALALAFQVTAQNPLPGLNDRVRLLNNVGRAIGKAPNVFGLQGSSRPGHLYDHLKSRSGSQKSIPARLILVTLLQNLGAAWPGARQIGAITIADAGYLPALRQAGAEDGLVPFHKLSQWLSYSLIEPLQEAGIQVRELDGLTGLAEYRNGGLLIDAGVLRLKDPAAQHKVYKPADELIVEWRALTVALLDRIAVRVREITGADANALPLGTVLQGGTWSAGRRIAARLRENGPPPLTLSPDGTLF